MSLFGGKGRHQGEFGSCCKDLHSALAGVPKSLFHVSPEGVLFLTVGMAETQDGVAWFDQAVIFCPFCAQLLQDENEIGRKAREATARSVH